MKDIYQILKKPVQTEKTLTAQEAEAPKYTFLVHKNANKMEIKQAVEKIFDVTVTNVRTAILPGKTKRMGRFEGKLADKKKAIVTLKKGDKIDAGTAE